ncbi:pyruvate dehydrogenase phosphatase regulatory subunit, mitochondrial isoform X2 [Centruroides vittatus]|uniref:pyruvate dehydrogenase phosphatase regulatory subunit, mitochondrial isoform X2 n=1 Tax=Centruroides vittatus TaxID=120091 RepID=UPI0035103FCD
MHFKLPLNQNWFRRHWCTCRHFLTSLRLQHSVLQDNITWDFISHKIPTNARVVICGGGVVGCSVAYHLVNDFGWKDVVLIEQGRLGGGTTWQGAGLLGQIKHSPIESRICQYSINLYKEFHQKGFNTGWKECGSLLLARKKDRMIEFRRLAAAAKMVDVECELLSPEAAQKHCPIISTKNLEGALWIPSDGVGDPINICNIFASEASKKGATIVEGCSIQRVITNERHCVSGVETNKGLINCDYFVNSAGVWARRIGESCHPQVKIPLYPCEHHFLHTLPVKNLDPMMPVIRDYDGYFYIRENNGRFLAGGFEPVSKPLDPNDIVDPSKPLPEDWDQFYVLLQEMLFRIPSLGDVEVDRLCNGAESFTPDCKWILGEAPEVKNYFIASGMKSIGIEAAGGVGKVTAEWMHHGEPTIDVWDLDIRRFLGLHNNPLFLRDRMREVPSLHYSLHYPFAEFNTGRCLRMSPIYPRLKAAGAVFNQTMAYERPAYFDPNLKDEPDIQEGGRRIAFTETFGKPPWFEKVQSEYHACRERVAILDYSSFTKLELWSPGREVVEVLQYLCSNDVDIPVNSIIHTGMQNKLGGYENDCSLIRLTENHYMMIAPTNQQTRCQSWIKRNLAADSTVSVTDVTSMYTAICLMGPSSRNLLTELTDSNLTPQEFPFFTHKQLNIGLASGIRVMNLTHTGELGYVLYIPNEYALHVYDRLIEAGEKYGIRHAGLYAMRTLRIEKFYAFWGQDLDTTTTPLECGRTFRVNFNKPNFIGKEALLRQKSEGIKRCYVQLVVEDHDSDYDLWPWGQEPIYLDDKCVGMTTTTGYGFTLGKQVCLGFVTKVNDEGIAETVTGDYVTKNTFEIDIAGTRYPATANVHSPKLTFIDYGDDAGYMATR